MEMDDEQHVREVLAGQQERRPDLSLAIDELRTELLDCMEPESAHRWLLRESASLDGRRPIDLVSEGQVEPVVRILIRMNAGIPT
jgi:uncharacterized protein (DUF2384 family)